MPKVVFLGSANMDTTIKLEGEFPKKGTAECLNKVENMMRVSGGKALNQALAFLKQYPEAEVCFVGCIGGVPKRDKDGNIEIDPITGKEVLIPDDSGKVIADVLSNPGEGLAFSEVVLKMFDKMLDENGEPILDDKGNPKPVKTDGRIIYVDKNGQNQMTGYGDAIKQLTRKNIPELDSILADADLVVIQLKMPPETVRYVIEYCSKNNIKLLVDPTPLDKSKILVENNCELLKQATYLSPNEEEAFALAMYAAGKDVEEVKELLDSTSPKQRVEMIKALVKTSPNIFATMGGDGVIFNKDGQVITQETYPTFCKDSTGAGDTFNGAFAASIMRDGDYETAILYGLIASSIKVQKEGAQNGVPSYEKAKKVFDEEERPMFVVSNEEVGNGEIPKTQHSTDDNDGDQPR